MKEEFYENELDSMCGVSDEEMTYHFHHFIG